MQPVLMERFSSFLLEHLPFVAEYDLSLMQGGVKITFPKRLGGFSMTRKHKGTVGRLAMRIDRSDKPGLLSVSVVKVDVEVGQVTLPTRLHEDSPSKSFKMVSLHLCTSSSEQSQGYLNVDSGEITPLEVTLELNGPRILSSLSPRAKPTLIHLTLVENLSPLDGWLRGVGTGTIAGGFLGGTTLAFAHTKPPPTPPPCGAACNCATPDQCPHGAGHGCGAPGCARGAAPPHGHCNRAGCIRRGACNGTCTLPTAHVGSHKCSHEGHAF